MTLKAFSTVVHRQNSTKGNHSCPSWDRQASAKRAPLPDRSEVTQIKPTGHLTMSALGSQHCALILLPPDKFSATNWTITFTLVLRFHPLFEIGPLSVRYVRKKV